MANDVTPGIPYGNQDDAQERNEFFRQMFSDIRDTLRNIHEDFTAVRDELTARRGRSGTFHRTFSQMAQDLAAARQLAEERAQRDQARADQQRNWQGTQNQTVQQMAQDLAAARRVAEETATRDEERKNLDLKKAAYDEQMRDYERKFTENEARKNKAMAAADAYYKEEQGKHDKAIQDRMQAHQRGYGMRSSSASGIFGAQGRGVLAILVAGGIMIFNEVHHLVQMVHHKTHHGVGNWGLRRWHAQPTNKYRGIQRGWNNQQTRTLNKKGWKRPKDDEAMLAEQPVMPKHLREELWRQKQQPEPGG